MFPNPHNPVPLTQEAEQREEKPNPETQSASIRIVSTCCLKRVKHLTEHVKGEEYQKMKRMYQMQDKMSQKLVQVDGEPLTDCNLYKYSAVMTAHVIYYPEDNPEWDDQQM